jgi:hypothetical protein
VKKGEGMKKQLDMAKSIIEAVERDKTLYACLVYKLLLADEEYSHKQGPTDDRGYVEGWADGARTGQRISFLRGQVRGRVEERKRLGAVLKEVHLKGQRSGIELGAAAERQKLLRRMRDLGISREIIGEVVR